MRVQKTKGQLKKGSILFIVLLIFLLGGTGQPVKAETIYDSPYVTFSPDGTAWTTNAEDQNVVWYASDGSDDVITGIASSLAELAEGEHFYSYSREGSIPVAKWIVSLSKVNCCHTGYPSREWHPDIPYTRQICLEPHFSGWKPICADCGEMILPWYIYMSKEAAESLHYIPADNRLTYYYLCPFNNNLEQGMDMGRHRCRAISANKYKVEYLPNTDGGSYRGFMLPSYHFYNNATVYEGKEVTPQTKLNPNRYERTGYRFAGWNTQKDGTGTFYREEEEILNLTAADFSQDEEAGCITLYAMWEKCVSRLELVLEQCSYYGEEESYSVQRQYGEEYVLDPDGLNPPEGHTVSFETNGGGELQPIVGKQYFVRWDPCGELKGKLRQNVYSFLGPDGNVDRVKPVFEYGEIVLPKPYKENSSFGGWYYDEEFTEFAGTALDTLVPKENLVLYAYWVELLLEAEDNYEEFDGEGAVDLSWRQPDGQRKVYKIYQKAKEGDWRQVLTTYEMDNDISVSETFLFDGYTHNFFVPYSGFYRIASWGAQGGNYGGYLGGKGGYAEGEFWLSKGDVLECTPGGQNGFNGGGKGSVYANGGGYSCVRQNWSIYLLFAGGGGGAGKNGNGYPGGMTQNLTTNRVGENGTSGGGGGFLGGRAGYCRVHSHEEGVCNHQHVGDAGTKGGCYTIPVKCGMKLTHKYTGTKHWYWGGTDEIYCPNCGADARKGETCIGHDTDYYKHVCPVHGKQKENSSPTSPSTCTQIAGYQLSCGQTEDYTCGYEDGEILASEPGYGGSNYINRESARVYKEMADVWPGSGKIIVSSTNIGLVDDEFLEGVMAIDEEAPDPVDTNSVTKEPIDATSFWVKFQKPKDHGSIYYHKAESYSVATGEKLCQSNVTKNEITTGVIGYFYCIDDAGRTIYGSAGRFRYISSPQVKVTLTTEKQYLHIAACDGVGNVGETIHIELGSLTTGSEGVKWPVYTEKLQIQEGENVYFDSQRDCYYVRSDGETGFRISNGAYIDGPAAPLYQMNFSYLYNICNGVESGNEVWIPSRENLTDTWELEARDLKISGKGEMPLEDANYTKAYLEEYGRTLKVVRDYVLQEEDHGETMILYPGVAVETPEEIVTSKKDKDRQNAITVIADGVAPEIHGLDILEDLMLVDRGKKQITLSVWASDDVSGVKEVSLEILNLDNGDYRVYYPDASGFITVDITEDLPLFSGDFSVTGYAVDLVGNEKSVTYSTTEFDLQADLFRVLIPHDPFFRKGEMGCLTVTTIGYADRVEIEFPEVFDPVNHSFNQVFCYEDSPCYRQEETIYFRIPFSIPDGENYEITVRAYKEGTELEQNPTLAVLGVEGNILDGIRTRLR